MATLQIGALQPFNLSDESLKDYYDRVEAGEDANTVAQDFFSTASTEAKNALDFAKTQDYYKDDLRSTNYDSILSKYGFSGGTSDTNYLMQLASLGSGATGSDALAALLQNRPQPTQYVPGSLTSGTPQVQAGTAPAPTSGGSNEQTFTPAYKAIILADGREVNYDYADPQARALADSGQLQIKNYDQVGQAPSGYQAPTNAPFNGGTQTQTGTVTNTPVAGPVPPTVNLQPGAQGPEVKQLQDWLVSQGYMTPEQVATGPGIYGPQTTAALAKWQMDHGVDNSSGVGFYGPRTMSAISSQVAPAQTGLGGIASQAEQIQQQLNTLAQAEKGGLSINDNTSVAEAEAFNSSPVGSYLNNLGITADSSWSDSFKTQPITSVQTLFDQIYKNSGLSELKGQIEAYNKKIQDYDDELFDKTQEVNDNPWYTEGIRQKKIAQLQEKYENKKANYVAALNRAQGLYDSGREDARWAVSQTIAQYNADRNFQQGQLEFAISRSEKAQEAAVRAKQQEFENNLDLERLALDQYQATRPTGGSGGLSASQINSNVNSIAGAFDNEPIVKEFNTIQGYVSLFNSLGTSASDDQARIYAFAKVMDPNSVVRESEYKTVQEYSQALLRAAGINVARVFTATGALSPDARTAMANTLNTKLQVQSGLYNQVSSEYQRQIDAAYSGQPRTITNYQAPAMSLPPIQGLVDDQEEGFWGKVGNWLFGN